MINVTGENVSVYDENVTITEDFNTSEDFIVFNTSLPNVSFQNFGPGLVEQRWYVSFYVVDLAGTPLSNVQIIINDSGGHVETGFTDGTGRYSTNLSQRRWNNSVQYDLNPYIFTYNRTPFHDSQHSMNITTNTDVTRVLTRPVGTPSVVLNPALIEVYVVDPVISQVVARIDIKNEGSANQEYTYYWWVTPRPLGEYLDGDTISRGEASKLLVPGETFTTFKDAYLDQVGTFYFRAKVYYGEYSYATDDFRAKETASLFDRLNALLAGRGKTIMAIGSVLAISIFLVLIFYKDKDEDEENVED